ncbi:hypothetical protein [Streptomyces sp. NPDC002082]|uniref:hypothetical protein n=1 Tax=Streptomyces sp. NPDC002082 TaxID=3154772 RepID=UPI00331B8DBA
MSASQNLLGGVLRLRATWLLGLPDTGSATVECPRCSPAFARTDVDATANDILRDLNRELRRGGVTLAVAKAKAPLLEGLAETGVWEELGERAPTVRVGVSAYRQLTE